MSFKGSLSSQLNNKNFYGYIEDTSSYRGVFHIDKNFHDVKFQLFLHDLNVSRLKNSLFSCSLWEISLTDDAINNHMENELGLICSLDIFANTFKDTILAPNCVVIKDIHQEIYEKERIQLLLTYRFESTTVLQGVFELKLIQCNLHPNIFEMLYSISKVNTFMADSKGGSNTSSSTNQLNDNLNTTVIVQESHHDTPKSEIKLLKKKRVITGGTKLYPNRKLNIK